MGANRQHLAAIAGIPNRIAGREPFGVAQRNQEAITPQQATKGSVVPPVHIDPEGVEPLLEIKTLQFKADRCLRALVAFDDVGEPISVVAGFLIGVLGRDAAGDGDIGEITTAEQGGHHGELGYKHLHALMGVADLHTPFNKQPPIALLHTPVLRFDLQR